MEEPNLAEILIRTEKEYQEISKLRLFQLEDQLKAKNHEIYDMSEKLEKIQEDFSYNLQLIDERDEELIELEGKQEILRKLVKEKDQEISEIRAHLAGSDEKIRNLNTKFSQKEKSLLEDRDSLRNKLSELKINKETEIIELKKEFDGERNKFKRIIEEYKHERLKLITKYEQDTENAENEYIDHINDLTYQLKDKDTQISKLISNFEELDKNNHISESDEKLIALELNYKSSIRDLEYKIDQKETEIFRLNEKIKHLFNETQELKNNYENELNYYIEIKTKLDFEIQKLKLKYDSDVKYITETNEVQVERIDTIYKTQIKKLQEKISIKENEQKDHEDCLEEIKQRFAAQERKIGLEMRNMSDRYEFDLKSKDDIIGNLKFQLSNQRKEIEDYKDKLEN